MTTKSKYFIVGIVTLFLCLYGCTTDGALSLGDLATVQVLAERKLTQTVIAGPDKTQAVTATTSLVVSATNSPMSGAQTSPSSPTSTPIYGGGKIAFISNRDGVPRLYMMDPDGKGQTRLTDHLLGSRDPAWSQDGQKLLYIAELGERQSSVRIIDVQNGLETVAANLDVESESPSWAPHDEIVLAADLCEFNCGKDDPTYYSRILTLNIEGGDRRQLSPSESRLFRPDVSSDGSRILVEFNNSIVVFRMSDFTQDPVVVPIAFHNSQDGAWSPDGRHIAFVSYQEDNYDLFIINISTGEITQLTDSTNSERFPSWSPDGQWIVFSTNRDGNWEIYVMSLDGSKLTRLTDDSGKDTEPDWSPAN